MIFLLALALIVLVVLFANALSKISSLEKRFGLYLRELNMIAGLASRIEKLERELSRLRADHSPAPPQAPVVPLPTVATAPAIAPTPAAGPPASTSAPSPGPATIHPTPAPWPPPPKKPSRSRAEWEAFIGGKLLNRIGALALILGVGFFLKYAFDNNLISETVRVLIGAAAGLACLAVARRTHTRGMPVFSQGLVGGGIAILYLSVYASFNYYHLVPRPVAIVLMSLVTLVTFWQGVSYDSLAVGLLGWAGGFLTPFLLSTGEPDETGLFSYIALLDVSILAVTFRKRSWVVLEPLSMVATWIVYLLWHDAYYEPGMLPVALPFIALFWLLFHAADTLRNLRAPDILKGASHLVPIVNLGVFYILLYTVLEERNHPWTAPATLILAALYFGTDAVMGRMSENARANRPRNLLVVAALVGVATAVQYSGYDTVLLWSLEAAILAWCGKRWNVPHLMAAGLIFLFGSAMKFADTPGAFFNEYPGEIHPVLNLRNLTSLVYCLALAMTAKQYRTLFDRTSSLVAIWLESAAGLVLFVCVTVTVNDFFSFRQSIEPPGGAHNLLFRRLMAIASSWTLYSLPFAWFGFKLRKQTLLMTGLFALLLSAALIAIRGIAFVPIEAFLPVWNVRVAASLLVLIAMMLHSVLIAAHRNDVGWLDDVKTFLGLGMGVVVFSMITGETRDYFEKVLHDLASGAGGGAEDQLTRFRNLQQLALSGVWLCYSGVLLAAGIWRTSKGLRFFSIGLFGLTILKIFVYDLSFLETLYRIFSFVGLGLILLAASYAYQRYKHLLFGNLAAAGDGSLPDDPPPAG